MPRPSPMRPLHFFFFFAFALSSVLPFGVANAELILNGSFERPNLTTGGSANFNPGEAIGDGWIVGGTGDGLLLQRPGVGLAADGAQHLLFANLPNSIFQDIPLLPSSTDHTVSFQMTALTTFAPGRLTVDILRNGNQISSQTFSQPALSEGSGLVYGSKSFAFRTVDSGTYRIQFTSGTFTPSYLDAVSVTAVPEPSSLLVLIVGVSAFAFDKRRVRRCQPTRC